MSASRRKRTKDARTQSRRESAAVTQQRTILTVPLTLTASLFALSFVPRVQAHPVLVQSFWTAALLLLVWQMALSIHLAKRGAFRTLETGVRPQHYVQSIVQLAVFAYWGWYWSPVYDHAWLIVGQLLFAYAFDMLLSWSRRERHVVGFGPFPIIFSTNLFLWFRDDWFFLQFLMIAIGFLGKEFVRWNRDGRRVHIFNPSAFSLGLFSLALITTGTTPISWGEEIATTLTLAPSIYLFLFLVGLVVMYFFSITLVAGSAAIILFGLSALYSASTGVPYFIDSEIPTAVFLGLHLLVTDPSTSPRTPLGKTIFGVMYGATVFVLYSALGTFGAPTFYDKLLSVPLLNLSVRWIDRLVCKISERPPFKQLAISLDRPSANFAHMTTWIVFFAIMTALGATDGRHRGDTVPFWEKTCRSGQQQGCARLLQIEASYCGDASGWACNELGRHYSNGLITEANPDLAFGYFARACELRFQAACLNILVPGQTHQADPKPLDLRLLLREGGANLMEMSEAELHARACDHEWMFACEGGP